MKKRIPTDEELTSLNERTAKAAGERLTATFSKERILTAIKAKGWNFTLHTGDPTYNHATISREDGTPIGTHHTAKEYGEEVPLCEAYIKAEQSESNAPTLDSI